MKTIICIIFFLHIIFLSAQSPMKTITGFCNDYQYSDDDSVNQAKDKTKRAAMKDGISRFATYIKSFTVVHNSRVTIDEIIANSEGLAKNIHPPVYTIDRLNSKCSCEITFDIDTVLVLRRLIPPKFTVKERDILEKSQEFLNSLDTLKLMGLIQVINGIDNSRIIEKDSLLFAIDSNIDLIKLFIRKLNKIEAHLQNSTLNDDEISKEIDDFQKKYAAFYKNDLKEKSYKERCNKLYKPQIKSNSTQMVLILVKSDTQNIEKKDKNKIKQIRDFYIGKTEITQRQYQIIMEKNPAKIYGVGDNYPVYNVTWYDAVEFCNKLSEIDSLEKCYTINKKKIECNFEANGYRLPLEAEWEYAAKGGNRSINKNNYSGSNYLDNVIWYSGNSGGKTKETETKHPNELGIYDMSGNVWEWCWNWFSETKQENTYGPDRGEYRVIKGGSWKDQAHACTILYRSQFNQENSSNIIGFRVVRYP